MWASPRLSRWVNDCSLLIIFCIAELKAGSLPQLWHAVAGKRLDNDKDEVHNVKRWKT
jgi:hypothetical protein